MEKLNRKVKRSISKMKKHRKIMVCSILAIAVGTVVTVAFSRPSKADESRLLSSGNFVFESGEKKVAFYAEDISYLQKEITALFHEMEDENE